MTFNKLELTAIVNLAMAVAKADGKVTNEETATVALELAAFGVSIDDAKSIIASAINISNKDAITIISLMDIKQKKYVAAFLAVIIMADGAIEDSEVKLWSLISLLCDLPTMSIAQGVEFWKKN